MYRNAWDESQKKTMYVYDRICSKEAKQAQISRAYGHARPHRSMSGERVYGKAFADSQLRRAKETEERARSGGRRYESPLRGNGKAYTYRPGPAGGGEAVKSRPFKLMIDRIVNFFDSIEERGKRDEELAKKHAIAWKKFSEYRHIIGTALALIAVTILFVFIVYKLFFVIEDVDISGSDLYTENEILLSSGFEVGDNLYSFTASDAENTITFMCPYIKSADVNRTIPKSVSIALEDDTASYYAVIWGDCVKLSAGLRVLEVVDYKTVREEEGLIELILPPVKYSVTGRVIKFAEPKNDRFIRSVLAEIQNSSLHEAGMVDEVDISDMYDIRLESCGRYLLRFGDEGDFDLKLRMAYRTMTSDEFDDLLPAHIDLMNVGYAVMRPDAGLRLD